MREFSLPENNWYGRGVEGKVELLGDVVDAVIRVFKGEVEVGVGQHVAVHPALKLEVILGTLKGYCQQCDQIGQFIRLWATFQSLWQQLVYPNLPHSEAIFVTVSKPFIYLVKSFLGNYFIDIW